jgi:hypothetical protein
MKRLAWLIALCPMLSFGMDRLEALSMIESGGNDRMVGRHGEISRYQILKREWRSVTQSTRYSDPAVAREVTLTLLGQRLRAFEQAHGRGPSNFEFYGLWNAPSQVLKGRVSPVVAERCRRYANLCSIGEKVVPPITPVPTVSPVMLAQVPTALR